MASRVPKIYIIRGHGQEYDKNLHILRKGIKINTIPELWSCFPAQIINIFAEGDIIHLWATCESGPVPLYGDAFLFVRYREGYVIDFLGITSEDRKCTKVAQRIFLNGDGIWNYLILLKPVTLNQEEKVEIAKALYKISFKHVDDPLRKWSYSKEIPLSVLIGSLEKRETAIKIIQKAVEIMRKSEGDH